MLLSIILPQVLSEFAGLHSALTEAGIQVDLHEHHLDHDTPDAVFPNNWFSTHRAGKPWAGVPVWHTGQGSIL